MKDILSINIQERTWIMRLLSSAQVTLLITSLVFVYMIIYHSDSWSELVMYIFGFINCLIVALACIGTSYYLNKRYKYDKC